MVFRKIDELNHLVAVNRGKSFEKVFYCEILFEMVNQCLYRHTCTFETGFTAKPFAVYPNDIVQRCLLYGGHTAIVAGNAGEKSG